MKLQNCFALLLCLYFKGDAQIRSLTVGDKVPNVVIKNIYNYPALQSKLSAFNKKLLILDFMGTNCSSCIKALPALDSLQKIYGDKVQILLVTNQRPEKVKGFLKLHPEINFPFIAEDTILHALFPHTFISHEVWIQDGIVKAITIPEYVTAKNIESLLHGEKIAWPVKKDIPDFDYTKPLIVSKSKAYTGFKGNMLNVPPRFTETKFTNSIRLTIINHPIIDLYLISRQEFNFPTSHIILEVNFKYQFVYDSAQYPDQWMRENTYCFESVIPVNTPREKRLKVIEEAIDKHFHIQGRFEKRKVQCFLLRKKEASTIQNKSKKLSLDQLVYSLNHTLYGTPVIDETGLDKGQKIYTKEDFDLVPEEREQVMFVITTKN